MTTLKNQIDYIEIFGLDYLWKRIDQKDISIDGNHITVTYKDDYKMEDYHVTIHGETQFISELTVSIIAKIQLYGSYRNKNKFVKSHVTDMDITSITIKECSNEQLLEHYRTELEKEIEYDLLDEFNEYTIDVAVHVKEN